MKKLFFIFVLLLVSSTHATNYYRLKVPQLPKNSTEFDKLHTQLSNSMDGAAKLLVVTMLMYEMNPKLARESFLKIVSNDNITYFSKSKDDKTLKIKMLNKSYDVMFNTLQNRPEIAKALLRGDRELLAKRKHDDQIHFLSWAKKYYPIRGASFIFEDGIWKVHKCSVLFTRVDMFD